MTIVVTDVEAEALIAERKVLPEGYRDLFELRAKRGHLERDFEVVGVDGNQFRIILRQSQHNLYDFSAILAWRPAGTTRLVRLRRYNGRSHRHTNRLEGDSLNGYHIHQVTERYQQSGFREDAFAEPTERYTTLREAIACLMADCNLRPAPDDQLSLLDEELP